jgi:hypothetical protein
MAGCIQPVKNGSDMNVNTIAHSKKYVIALYGTIAVSFFTARNKRFKINEVKQRLTHVNQQK